MASMKDVAALAGVSISTVSRVISKRIPVDEGTERRVREAIRKLQYRPNLLASGLRMKSGRAVGLILPRLDDPYFARLVSSVERCVSERGYFTHIGNTRDDSGKEGDLIQSMIQRHVDGIIFSRVSDDSRAIEMLLDIDIPVVIFDRAIHEERIFSVVLDNHRAGCMAAEYLLSRGHRRIACIAGPPDITIFRDRQEGFVQTLADAGYPIPERRISYGDTGFLSGAGGMRALLDMAGEGFTAVWAHNDLMALGALRLLAERRVGVPGEIAVMGLDNINLGEMVFPSLTTIAQPYDELARIAVEMVMDPSKYTGPDLRRVVVGPELVVREST